MLPSDNFVFDTTDTDLLDLAWAFYRGFNKEMEMQNAMIASLQEEGPRQDAASRSPEYGKFFEGKTFQELNEQKVGAAIAFGVAVAVKYALEKRDSC